MTGVDDRQINATSRKMLSEVQVQSVRIYLRHSILKAISTVNVPDLVLCQCIGHEFAAEVFGKRVHGDDARLA